MVAVMALALALVKPGRRAGREDMIMMCMGWDKGHWVWLSWGVSR